MKEKTETGPVIETASADDAEAVAKIYRRSFFATYPSFQRLHSHAEDREHFGDMIASQTVLLAKAGGTSVGYCAFNSRHLIDLYIIPEHQGRGLGKHLLARAMERAETLELWTFQENLRARAFYEAHGFVAAETTSGEGNEHRQPDMRYVWVRKSDVPP